MAGSTYSRQEEARYTLQLNKMLDALQDFLLNTLTVLNLPSSQELKLHMHMI